MKPKVTLSADEIAKRVVENLKFFHDHPDDPKSIAFNLWCDKMEPYFAQEMLMKEVRAKKS